MAFAKDQWTKAVKQADGSVDRVRNEKRWGRGKRWLGVWTDLHGEERSKAFETKVQATRYASAMETDRDRGDYLDPDAGKVRLDEIWPRWHDHDLASVGAARRRGPGPRADLRLI
ncbi:hypothetical protein E0H73_43985 [Kribbella pittospori]|uniref:Uncharacterized protein n=1 Tax=Kribbella pittospori TaxID=722689 RepID=A0A4R0JN57_9ACTN|nr:hypothetical protein [Kribbella pittospori]TCC46308.1 hypothetical protein E0H73_43985 [Kribbella pittospori]